MLEECEKFNKLLDKLIENDDISDEDKAFMEKHSCSCDTCKQELGFVKSITKTLHDLPKLEVPSDFKDKVNARIDTELKITPIKRFAGHIVRNGGRYSAVAACLVLAVVIGFGPMNIADNMQTGENTPAVMETNSPTEHTIASASAVPEVTPQTAQQGEDVGMFAADATPIAVVTPRPLPTRSPAESNAVVSGENAVKQKNTDYGKVSGNGTAEAIQIPKEDNEPKYSQSETASAPAENTPAVQDNQNVSDADNLIEASPPAEKPENGTEADVSVAENSGVAEVRHIDQNTEAGVSAYTAEETSENEDDEMVDGYSVIDGHVITPPGIGISGVTAQNPDTNSEYSMNNTVSISEEDEQKVLEMLSQYSKNDGSDGDYYLTTAAYKAFLNELDNNGIQYTLSEEATDGSDGLVKIVIKKQDKTE